MIQVTDLNNDTQLDIIVANFGRNTISIFYDFENYSFTETKQLSTNSSRSIAILTVDLIYDIFRFFSLRIFTFTKGNISFESHKV